MKQRTDESPMAETRDASDWTEDYSRLFIFWRTTNYPQFTRQRNFEIVSRKEFSTPEPASRRIT